MHEHVSKLQRTSSCQRNRRKIDGDGSADQPTTRQRVKNPVVSPYQSRLSGLVFRDSRQGSRGGSEGIRGPDLLFPRP